MGGAPRRSLRRALSSVGAATALAGLLSLGAPASLGARTTGLGARTTGLRARTGLRAAAADKKPRTRASVTVFADQTAGPRLLGLGVQWDPYDSFQPSASLWDLIDERVAFMSPGFLRVVEPASDYFKGYDSAHDPTYRWGSTHVQELLQILAFAQKHHITVVLGDWADPLIHDDARIPADFIEQLHDTYGFTDIRYYDPLNEPNYDSSCDFTCWTNMMTTLHREFAQLGMKWIKLIGPSNGNSWDDTPQVHAADEKTGLDTDNPANDAWVTETLQAIPSEIGAYDSHRYSTIGGLDAGVYEEQMLTRRDEISNLDSPGKPFFEGEVGLTVRKTNPFASDESARYETQGLRRELPALVDPSAAPASSTFVDSQPHIAQFNYGTWMGDMVIQALDGGLSGASAWDLDDAMHTGGGYGSQNLKRWGFWNSLGGQDGYPASDLDLRPWYYAWSVLSRSFPAGAQALTVPSTGLTRVRVAAARVPRRSGYALSFALVNENRRARRVRLFVPDARRRLRFALYDYFNRKRPVDKSGFPVPARIVRGVDLARGYWVRLPSQGLAVLSSLGRSSTKLSGAAHTFIDHFRSFRGLYRRSRGLRIDTSRPLVFDGDGSRVTVAKPGRQYLIYRAPDLTSFELKLYAETGPSVEVYTSADDRRWRRVPLASTPAAPALEGGGWFLEELLPRVALRPAGFLKIVLPGPRTELGQVRIQDR